MGPWLGCLSPGERGGSSWSFPALQPCCVFPQPLSLNSALAELILQCWGFWGIGVAVPDMEVGGPGLAPLVNHFTSQFIISLCSVTFLDVPGYGTSLFDLTFISETTERFHAHPF